MRYNPAIHHRRSIRLKDYDYSQAGLYFITICCQNRACLFGNIENGAMNLNDAGKMIEKWYYELENKYPDKRCHEMIVMPNHFHCIIENIPNELSAMDASFVDMSSMDGHVGTSLCGRTNTNEYIRPNPQYGINNKKYNATIGNAINWFKTMTTNEYIHCVKNYKWQAFNKKLWQGNYWERIIRNEESYLKISDYIKNNPAKWDKDKLK